MSSTRLTEDNPLKALSEQIKDADDLKPTAFSNSFGEGEFNVAAKGILSPISVATREGHHEEQGTQLIEFLIRQGVNVNLANGKTAIHCIITLPASLGWDLQRLTELLVEAKVNWNAQDKQGNTALHVAVKDKNLKWINILAQKTDLNLKNEDGETVIDIVDRMKSEKIFPEFQLIKAILINTKLIHLTSPKESYTKESARFFTLPETSVATAQASNEQSVNPPKSLSR